MREMNSHESSDPSESIKILIYMNNEEDLEY